MSAIEDYTVEFLIIGQPEVPITQYRFKTHSATRKDQIGEVLSSFKLKLAIKHLTLADVIVIKLGKDGDGNAAQ